MGRDVKRVPLDFDWPLNEVWEGYLAPDRFEEEPCPEACLRGATAARAWVAEVTRLLLMLDDDLRAQRLERPMHPYFASVPEPHRLGDPRVPRPSVDIADFGTGLAGRVAGSMGHDAIDQWRAEEKILQAAGLDPDVWGRCPGCGGHGSVEAYPGQRAESEAWELSDPPEGEGWQLWETVSEGSPVSPVFAASEDLARWLTTPDGGAAAGPSKRPLTIEQARGFVGAGWAPSLIQTAGGVHDGATFVGTDAALKEFL